MSIFSSVHLIYFVLFDREATMIMNANVLTHDKKRKEFVLELFVTSMIISLPN